MGDALALVRSPAELQKESWHYAFQRNALKRLKSSGLNIADPWIAVGVAGQGERFGQRVRQDGPRLENAPWD